MYITAVLVEILASDSCPLVELCYLKLLRIHTYHECFVSPKLFGVYS